MEAGYDICAVQELLGHQDVSTTVVDTHVLKRVGLGVRSPVELRVRPLGRATRLACQSAMDRGEQEAERGLPPDAGNGSSGIDSRAVSPEQVVQATPVRGNRRQGKVIGTGCEAWACRVGEAETDLEWRGPLRREEASRSGC